MVIIFETGFGNIVKLLSGLTLLFPNIEVEFRYKQYTSPSRKFGRVIVIVDPISVANPLNVVIGASKGES